MTPELSKAEAIALYEQAPCGYISTSLDGTIIRTNDTFAKWAGYKKTDPARPTKLQEFLSASSKIFYDTHYFPLLQMHGSVADIALEIYRQDKTPLPVLVASIIRRDLEGKPLYVSTTLFDITERRRFEHEIISAKRKAEVLADVVRYSDTAIITTSYDLVIETWNTAAEKLFERSTDGTLQVMALDSLLPPQCMEVLSRGLESNSSITFEHLFPKNILCEVKAYPTLEGLAIFFSDITENRASETALRNAHERFNLATMATTDGIWDWDCLTGELYMSARIQAILGLPEVGVIVTIDDWLVRIHPKDIDKVRANLARIFSTVIDRFDNQYRVRHENGSWRWIQNRGMAVYGPSKQLIRLVGSLTDITLRKVEDPLTGLHSRLSLLEHLEFRLANKNKYSDRCALLFIDLDGFKRVNDSFGNKSGDSLLLEFARRMVSLLAPDPNSFVARLGGDEFAVLLHAVVDEKDALQRSREIQQLLQKPILCGEHSITLSASIGVALSRESTDTAEGLLRDADVAMFQAKSGGKAQSVVFSERMIETLRERIALENDLRRALEAEELVLYYQPKVVLETGRIIGFEALIRWKHHVRGMVPPDLFIAIAEESNFICEIGRWTIHEAIKQLAQWRRAGVVSEATTVAINLSPKQFSDVRLIQVLTEELTACGLPAMCVELEVTEGVLIQDATEALRVLQQLKAIGVGLELDDFGRGYSSLSYLNRYPFNSLKVDRSFVSNLEEEGDGDGATITRSIIALGKALGLEVIAEGIENECQVQRLLEMGCVFGQGYLFSKPLPAAEIADFMSGAMEKSCNLKR